jgi:mono/diheme cytochrome c family protein
VRASAVGLVVAALALGAAGCGGSSGPAGPSGLDGKTLFIQQCGSCHTLADAGTKGTFGADLERLRPNAAAVLNWIDTGGKNMPAHILGGQDAKKVSAYVAKAVRRPKP